MLVLSTLYFCRTENQLCVSDSVVHLHVCERQKKKCGGAGGGWGVKKNRERLVVIVTVFQGESTVHFRTEGSEGTLMSILCPRILL